MLKFQQQLKRGLLEMLTLQIIHRNPTYGYNIRGQLKEKSGGQLVVEDGTLYPILYRLENDGMITASWVMEPLATAIAQPSDTHGKASQTAKTAKATKTTKGKPHKIYTITPLGEQTVQAQYAYWCTLSNTISSFFEEVAQ